MAKPGDAVVAVLLDVVSIIVDAAMFVVRAAFLAENLAVALIDSGAAGLEPSVLGGHLHWWPL